MFKYARDVLKAFMSLYFQRMRNTRNAQNRNVTTGPEEASRNRKSSTFTDILSRNRKSVQDEGVPGRKLSAMPEQAPKNRKTSTFTDIMSRNRKISTTPEVMPPNRRSTRKPSVIAEEVRHINVANWLVMWHSFLSYLLF